MWPSRKRAPICSMTALQETKEIGLICSRQKPPPREKNTGKAAFKRHRPEREQESPGVSYRRLNGSEETCRLREWADWERVKLQVKKIKNQTLSLEKKTTTLLFSITQRR